MNGSRESITLKKIYLVFLNKLTSTLFSLRTFYFTSHQLLYEYLPPLSNSPVTIILKVRHPVFN